MAKQDNKQSSPSKVEGSPESTSKSTELTESELLGNVPSTESTAPSPGAELSEQDMLAPSNITGVSSEGAPVISSMELEVPPVPVETRSAPPVPVIPANLLERTVTENLAPKPNLSILNAARSLGSQRPSVAGPLVKDTTAMPPLMATTEKLVHKASAATVKAREELAGRVQNFSPKLAASIRAGQLNSADAKAAVANVNAGMAALRNNPLTTAEQLKLTRADFGFNRLGTAAKKALLKEQAEQAQAAAIAKLPSVVPTDAICAPIDKAVVRLKGVLAMESFSEEHLNNAISDVVSSLVDVFGPEMLGSILPRIASQVETYMLEKATAPEASAPAAKSSTPAAPASKRK